LDKFNGFTIDSVHVQLATLTHTKHTYMWVKSKNTTSCMQQNQQNINQAKQLLNLVLVEDCGGI
jgi:hypothetical protein